MSLILPNYKCNLWKLERKLDEDRENEQINAGIICNFEEIWRRTKIYDVLLCIVYTILSNIIYIFKRKNDETKKWIEYSTHVHSSKTLSSQGITKIWMALFAEVRAPPTPLSLIACKRGSVFTRVCVIFFCSSLILLRFVDDWAWMQKKKSQMYSVTDVWTSVSLNHTHTLSFSISHETQLIDSIILHHNFRKIFLLTSEFPGPKNEKSTINNIISWYTKWNTKWEWWKQHRRIRFHFASLNVWKTKPCAYAKKREERKRINLAVCAETVA